MEAPKPKLYSTSEETVKIYNRRGGWSPSGTFFIVPTQRLPGKNEKKFPFQKGGPLSLGVAPVSTWRQPWLCTIGIKAKVNFWQQSMVLEATFNTLLDDFNSNCVGLKYNVTRQIRRVPHVRQSSNECFLSYFKIILLQTVAFCYAKGGRPAVIPEKMARVLP